MTLGASSSRAAFRASSVGVVFALVFVAACTVNFAAQAPVRAACGGCPAVDDPARLERGREIARGATTDALDNGNALIEVARIAATPVPVGPSVWDASDVGPIRAARFLQRLEPEGVTVLVGTPASLLVHRDGEPEFTVHPLRARTGPYQTYEPQGFAIAGPPGARRLFTGFAGFADLDVYDLDEALRPTFRRRFEACGLPLLPIEGGERLLSVGACTALVDTATGDLRAYLGDRSARVAVASDLIVLARTIGPSGVVETHHVASTGVTAPLASVATPAEEVFIDRAAEIVVVQTRAQGSRTRFEIRAASTLALLGELFADDLGAATLVGGGTTSPVLAVGSAEALTLYDLGNPSAPSFMQSIGGAFAALDAVSDTRLVARDLSSARPAIVLIDVRDASVVGRFETEGGVPVAAVVDADGSRFAVLSKKADWNQVFEPGGIVRVDVLEPQGNGVLARVSGASGIGIGSPLRDESVTAWGGRYAVLTDVGTNSVLAIDLSLGRTVPQGGFSGFGAPISWPDCSLDARGSWLALSCSSRGAEAVKLDPEGISERVRRIRGLDETDPAWRAGGHAVGEDGALFLWTSRGLEVAMPDGSIARMPEPSLTDYWSRIELSPSGSKVLLHGAADYDATSQIAVAEVATRSAPRLLWEKADGPVIAHFARRDESVFATYGDFASFTPRLLAGESGEPLGPDGDSQWQFFYHGLGATWSGPSGDYAVTWNWLWSADASAFWDLTTGTPRRIGPESVAFSPEYAPKSDGSGWYELHDLRYHHQPGPSLLYTGALDGALTRRGVVDASRFIALRPGFLIGVVGWGSHEILLLRDPAMNRAPVAVADGDRTVECTSPSGTPVTLDGGASYDPDSAPGTSDDIARVAWSVDGALVATEWMAHVDLAVGAHEATLDVQDVLDATGTARARIDIVDTRAPEVSLALSPLVDGGAFSRRWRVDADGVDACEGGSPIVTELLLPEPLAGVVPHFIGGSPTPEILVTRGGSSLAIEVRASTPDGARLIWEAIARDASIPIASGEPVLWWSSRASAGPASLAYRYRLDAEGRLESAEAFGPSTDHVLQARAKDSSGNEGIARISYRAHLADLCAAGGGDFACAP